MMMQIRFFVFNVWYNFGFKKSGAGSETVKISGCALQCPVTPVKVSVRFFTSLREITGKREEILEFSRGEGATVEDALKRLGELHGKSFAEYVYDPKSGEVRGFLQFLVNGRNVTSNKGLKTKLSNGDVLAIIPPVGGG